MNGNIYIVESGSPPALLGSGGLSAVPVSKLSLKSRSTLAYPGPSLDHYRGVVRLDFDVSADGHLYGLLEALDASAPEDEPPPSFFIARYEDDGSLDSHFKLGDAPDRRLQPFRFAMFRDGNVLVTGTSVAQKGLQPFLAVLDRGGRFVTYVKALRDAEPTKPDKYETLDDYAVTLSSNSFMISAPDGNIYVLRGADQYRLFVISSAGEIVREFEIPSPAPDLTVTNMGMAGDDRIFVSFGGVGAGADSDGTNSLISVINPQTGKVDAVYRPTDQKGAFDIPACAAATDNFLFVGATQDNQHQQVRRYLPR